MSCPYKPTTGHCPLHLRQWTQTLAVQQKLKKVLKSDIEEIVLKVRLSGVHTARAILSWSGARQNRVSSCRVQILL